MCSRTSGLRRTLRRVAVLRRSSGRRAEVLRDLCALVARGLFFRHPPAHADSPKVGSMHRAPNSDMLGSSTHRLQELASISAQMAFVFCLFSFASSRFLTVRSTRSERKHLFTSRLRLLHIPMDFHSSPRAWHTSSAVMISSHPCGVSAWLTLNGEPPSTCLYCPSYEDGDASCQAFNDWHRWARYVRTRLRWSRRSKTGRGWQRLMIGALGIFPPWRRNEPEALPYGPLARPWHSRSLRRKGSRVCILLMFDRKH